jgi:PAS domain S-box-containing protein
MVMSSRPAASLSNPRLPDNPLIACNAAFEELTGYTGAEVLGRNCRFLAGPRDRPLLSDEMREAVRLRRPVIAEIPNFRKDGTPFRNAVMIAPIFDAEGELEYFLGMQAEVFADRAEPSANRQALSGLTGRQRDVLAGMVAGKRYKIIAYELGISERTVKMHRAGLLARLGLRSTAEAIRFAVEADWLATVSNANA